MRYITAPSLVQEYHELDTSDVYSQIVFNRTTEEVTKFERQESRPAFTPSWILKITWDHVMPVFYHNINASEVKTLLYQLTSIHLFSCLINQTAE